MGKHEDLNTISRRDILKLAGTAAAFCTSFGFLHGDQSGRTVEDKHAQQGKLLQAKWQQAEVKWYSGGEVLHSSAIPSKVVKHLGSNENATVEVKLFRAGSMLKNLGTIEAKL